MSIALSKYCRSCDRQRYGCRLAGFTLVELMITLAVAAILLALAMPSFSSMLMNNRQSGQAVALLSALNYARSTALTQSINVQVCPFGAVSSPTCGSNWSAGWIVATVPASGSSVLLQSYQVGPRDPLLTAVAAGGAAPATIVFDARGLAAPQGNFQICDRRGSGYARSLQVLSTGLIQLAPTPGQAIWGGSLSC